MKLKSEMIEDTDSIDSGLALPLAYVHYPITSSLIGFYNLHIFNGGCQPTQWTSCYQIMRDLKLSNTSTRYLMSLSPNTRLEKYKMENNHPNVEI